MRSSNPISICPIFFPFFFRFLFFFFLFFFSFFCFLFFFLLLPNHCAHLYCLTDVSVCLGWLTAVPICVILHVVGCCLWYFDSSACTPHAGCWPRLPTRRAGLAAIASASAGTAAIAPSASSSALMSTRADSPATRVAPRPPSCSAAIGAA
ncbi:hypothetical protein T492DRAFT_36099 [Pavlovales sp. CCMP2436]|nr:hypothetical protein T492DRAFT_36099 [Pavlovales sp. CCMP2436]